MLYNETKTIDNTIELIASKNPFYLDDPELKKRHENALPSKEAYLFFPKGNEVILYNEKKPSRSIRRIYLGVEYSSFEKEQLKKFKQMQLDYDAVNSKRKINYPEGWNDGDNLRYIYSTNCNLEKALHDMISHFKWRTSTFPMNISNKVIEILNLGFLYIHGRDYQFRPVMICQAHVYIKHEKEYTYEEWLYATLFISQYICTYLMIPGQIENWVMITNATNAQILFLPNSMKKIIGIMSDQFRSKLYMNFIVGLSSGMKFLYKIICKFLDECTVKKMIVVDQLNDGKLTNQISPSNLEEKFGGTAPDVKYEHNKVFPPIMPSVNFLKDNDRKSEVLDNEDAYSKKYKNNELLTVSPFYLQKKASYNALLNSIIERKIESNICKKDNKDSILFKRDFFEEKDYVQSPIRVSVNSYCPPHSLIDQVDQFNNRKRFLNN